MIDVGNENKYTLIQDDQIVVYDKDSADTANDMDYYYKLVLVAVVDQPVDKILAFVHIVYSFLVIVLDLLLWHSNNPKPFPFVYF